jgi:hypothetical protein
VSFLAVCTVYNSNNGIECEKCPVKLHVSALGNSFSLSLSKTVQSALVAWKTIF